MDRKFGLTLVRHGETEMNKLRILQGQLDEPLNETGKAQSIHLGKKISNQRYSHIFSSDLKRAKDTCELVVSQNSTYLGNHEKSPKIKLDVRLRERKFGCMEGKPASDMSRIAHQQNKSAAAYTPDGAETPLVFRERARHFFRNLCSKVKEEMDARLDQSDNFDVNVLIVSHGGLIRVMFATFIEEFGCVFDGNHWSTRISNASRSDFVVSLPLPDTGCGEFPHQKNGGDWVNGVTVKCVCFNDTA